MRHIIIFVSALLMLMATKTSAQTKTVEHFNKIIISPYIQVNFVQGNEESVTINNIEVDKSKLHIEVNNNVLWLYLDGAKNIPKNEKDEEDGRKEKHPLYNKTTVTATITYKTLEALSVRGEESHVCEGAINGDAFSLNMYGESSIVFNEINVQNLYATLYGEGRLEIKAGTVTHQKYTCYGEGKINALAIQNTTANVTAYGDADFKLNTSDRIKITAFGDATLHYTGNASIDKGIHIGDMVIDKMN